MNRVSTATLQNSTMTAALQAQANYAQAATQEASGLVSQTYGGLGSEAGTLLDLEDELNQASAYATEATSVGNRVQSMYSAIGTIVSAMTTLESTLSSAVSGSTTGNTTTSLNSAGTAALDAIEQALDTQYGSDYVFSGAKTDTAPVNLSGYTASVDTANTSYYQGDDAVASVRISSQQSVSYGVTADNSAFEEALRAAYVASTASISDTTTIEDAYGVAKSAITALSSLQAEVSQSASTLSNEADRESSCVTFMTSAVSDIKNVDTANIAAQVSAYQSQLTASYDAVAKVLKISLSSYL